MIRSSTRRAFRTLLASHSRPATRNRRLEATALEQRLAPAALLVTSSADDGSPGTFRSVMATADSNGQDDTITFQAGVTSINLLTGQISLTTDNKLLTISGPGVTISGSPISSTTNRILDINVTTGNPTITLVGLTLTGCNLATGQNGAAIRIHNDPLVLDSVDLTGNFALAAGGAVASTSAVAGNLTITNCNVVGNSAGAAGGAIAGLSTLTLNVSGSSFAQNTANNNGGAISTAGATTASVTSSTFTANVTVSGSGSGGAIASTGASSNWTIGGSTFDSNVSTTGNGGAIRVSGSATMTVDATTIAGNSANSPIGSGGGISFGTSGSLAVTNSTVSGNFAVAGGGGLYVTTAAATLTNSTISGNSVTNATGTGGGLFITSGTLTINNSTLTANAAGTVGGSGGGIRKSSTTGAVTINSSIIAGNFAPTGGADIHNSTTLTLNVLGGSNVVGVADAGAFTLAGVNKTGTAAVPLDPVLSPIGSFGGPTATHKLLAGSPAFNVGSNALALSFDQRGAGFPRVIGGVADAGAFEGVSPIPAALATTPGVPPVNPTYVVTVVYSDDVGINTATIDVNDVRLSGPGYVSPAAPISVGVSGSGTSVTATYTFTPPGGAWEYTENGIYTLTLQSGEVLDTDGPNAVPAGDLSSFAVSLAVPALVVDNPGDTNDSNFGPGQLTLREAVFLTNSSPGTADSISFAPALSGQTITLNSAIQITDPVAITGLGAGNLTIKGAGNNRHFDVTLGAATSTVAFSDMKLTEGQTTIGFGGSISVSSGSLALTGMDVSGNTASSSSGGGGAIAYGSTGTLTVTNSTLSDNATPNNTTAGGGGGAIIVTTAATVSISGSLFNNNTTNVTTGANAVGGALRSSTSISLAISDSTFTNNQGSSGGVAYLSSSATVTVNRSVFTSNLAMNFSSSTQGGGAFHMFSSGSLTISDSAFITNTANSVGGVISSSSASITINNSTLTGNAANLAGTANGGGALMITGTSTVTINNSTLTENLALSSIGGAIHKTTTGGLLTLNSTIVAGNSAVAGSGQDIECAAGTPTAIGGGSNLVGVVDAGNFTLAGTNKFGTLAAPLNPQLLPLAANGGPTPTHALKAGSPAFSSGSNPLALAFDQRGTGFPRVVQGLPDIGAYEGFNTVPQGNATLPGVPPTNATYTATVVYTDNIGMNAGSIDVNDVRLSGKGYASPEAPTGAKVVSGTTGDPSITVEYTFTPPGGAWDPNDTGLYTLEIQAGQVFDTDGPNAATAGPIGTFYAAIPLPTLVVDDASADVDDGIYTPGNLTLREAVNLANAQPLTHETITFAPALSGSTITLGSTINITDPLSISGPGAANLTVTGGVGLFATSVLQPGSDVVFSGLTLSGGTAATGAAILAGNEDLSVIGCVVQNNSGSSFGGAVYITGASGSLTVDDCWFDNNASTAGGAITVQNGAGLLVTDSLFTSNFSTNASNSGGAIRYNGTPGAFGLTLRNSTFSGNKVMANGSAISIATFNTATALIQNCTITGNTADSDGSGAGDAAIALTSGTGKLLIESSIVAGNIKGTVTPVASDIFGATQISADRSLLGTSTGASLFVPDATTTSLLGQDPMLDGLAANGGPTQTMALKAGSPAINAGSNPAGLVFDQRGTGYFRFGSTATDIGAFEVQAPAAKVVALKVNDGSIQRSRVLSLTITFDQNVALPANPADAFTLKRQSDNATVALNAVQAGSEVTLTLTGGPIEFGSLADGRYTLMVSAGQVNYGNFDGDGNGTAGDDYTLVGSPANGLFRLYGDSDGSAQVDSADFLAFRLAFLSSSPTFDADGSGQVDSADFLRFRLNFLKTI